MRLPGPEQLVVAEEAATQPCHTQYKTLKCPVRAAAASDKSQSVRRFQQRELYGHPSPFPLNPKIGTQ